jgi:hypothetical protein
MYGGFTDMKKKKKKNLENMEMKYNAMVSPWADALASFREWRDSEIFLREKIANYILDGQLYGSVRRKVGIYTLTATANTSTKVDFNILRKIWKKLSKKERSCFVNPKKVTIDYDLFMQIRPNLSKDQLLAIEVLPALDINKFKTLPDDSNLHKAITQTPGLPKLEV